MTESFRKQRCRLSLLECEWKGASGKERVDHVSESQGDGGSSYLQEHGKDEVQWARS